jgi:hypothetical protein
MPMLTLAGDTRGREPKRLRLQFFSAAAQPVNTGRRRWLRFTARRPGATRSPSPTASADSKPYRPRLTSHFDRHDNPHHPGKGNPATTRRDNRAAILPDAQKAAPRRSSLRQRTDKDS